MANGNADATLVSAAYRMGMANVPADTSKTFMRQYEALAGIEVAKINMQQQNIQSVATLATKGIDTYAKIKTAERQEERDTEFDSGFIDLARSTIQEKGKNWSNYKEGQVADQTSINHQKKKLEVIKEELTRLKKLAKGNPENLDKIAKLEKNVINWRDQTNKNISDFKVHSELWLNDDVDTSNSFKVLNPKTGIEEFSPQMGLLYNQVMDPSVDLDDAGVTPQEKNGREGYLFDPKQDRLALEYKMSKASMLGYDPKAKTTGFFEKKYSNEGAGYGGKKIELAEKRNFSWISRDELLSMVKKKDKDLPLNLTGKMTEILTAMNATTKGQRTDNGDGTFSEDKSKIKYTTGSYSDIEAKSEKGFYDIIMAPTTTVGKKQVSRDVKGGIAYISNNEIFLGNTPINYSEMKQKDFNVDVAVINQMGIGSDIFTAEELKDGKIDAAELEKHLGAKKEIFKVLFNPQTKEETEVAAREIAKFFNLQTKIKANSDRGNIKPAVSGLTPEQIAANKALETTENFAHINKGGYAKLDGESIQKGSLEGIRTSIENRKGFYIGDNNFRADGKSGWKRETPDGAVTTYKSISELIKSGLRTTDKGFISLISKDYNSDGKPDAGPFKPINLDFS